MSEVKLTILEDALHLLSDLEKENAVLKLSCFELNACTAALSFSGPMTPEIGLSGTVKADSVL